MVDTPSVPRNLASGRRCRIGRSLLLLLAATSLPAWAQGEPCADYSAHPPILGTIGLPSGPVHWEDFTVSGGYAYIAEQYGDPGFGGHPRLGVVDVSDPTAPVYLGAVDSPNGVVPGRVAAWKEHAYLVIPFIGGGLGVVDASAPENPVWVRTMAAGGVSSFNDVAVRPETAPGAGDARLVAVVGAQTRLYSLSQPSNPVLMGSIPQVGELVVVVGDYAYTALDSVVKVIDISGTAPSLVTTVHVPEPVEYGEDLSAEGGFLCLATSSDNRKAIQVFDISSPGTISFVGAVDTFIATLAAEQSVAVHAGSAYVTALGGISMLSLSGPGSPALLGTFPGNRTALCADGDYLYTLSELSGLKIVDISAPAFVPLLGGLRFNRPSGLALRGQTAFVTHSAGLTSVDVSDPVLPVAIGNLSAPRGDVAIAGNYAYVGVSAQLNVVDIDDPAMMQIVASAPITGHVEALSVMDGVACVADAAGLEVFDVSNPLAPMLSSTIPVTGGARDVTIAAGHAFVTKNNGLLAIDISPPDSAHVVGALPMSEPFAVSVQDEFAYVTGWSLAIVDIANPSNLAIVSSTPLDGFGSSPAIDGTLLYVAEGYHVLAVDVSDPTSPFVAGLLPTPADAERVAVANGHLFIVEGLLAYPLHCPTTTAVEPASSSPVAPGIRIVPNPMSGTASFVLPVGIGAATGLAIHDVHGRLVRRWSRGSWGAAPAITWDGRDAGGRQVPAGVYWVRLGDDSRSPKTAKITVVR